MDADELRVGGDRLTTVDGSLYVVVGAPNATAELQPGVVHVEAEERIVLRVGNSVLRITADRIELESGGKARLLLGQELSATAQGGVLELNGQVKLASAQALSLEASEAVSVKGKGIQLNS